MPWICLWQNINIERLKYLESLWRRIKLVNILYSLYFLIGASSATAPPPSNHYHLLFCKPTVLGTTRNFSFRLAKMYTLPNLFLGGICSSRIAGFLSGLHIVKGQKNIVNFAHRNFWQISSCSGLLALGSFSCHWKVLVHRKKTNTLLWWNYVKTRCFFMGTCS